MTIDEILSNVQWFTRWVTPAGKTHYACRAIGALASEQFVGETPSEALEKMRAATEPLPNPELF
jgi:hypothetical protein